MATMIYALCIYLCLSTSNITWLQKSPCLDAGFVLQPSDDSRALIRKCVEYRLSQGMLEKTKLNSNTQKCEASNRSMRRSLPKNNTFIRNFPGRAHSAAHNLVNQYLSFVNLSVRHFLRVHG